MKDSALSLQNITNKRLTGKILKTIDLKAPQFSLASERFWSTTAIVLRVEILSKGYPSHQDE
jgi:hypothetical protein